MLHVAIARLRAILETLYNDTSKVRMVAGDAGLDLAVINFHGSARLVWENILEEAHKQRAITEIVAIAKKDYSPSAEDLDDALANYLPFRSSPWKPAAADAQRLEHATNAGTRLQQPVDSRPETTVLVLAGRDMSAIRYVTKILETMQLTVRDWQDAIGWAERPDASNVDVIRAASKRVSAVIALLTGDENALVRNDLRVSGDPVATLPLPQPTTSLSVRAGIALALLPEKTVLVQYGHVRDLPDLRWPIVLDASGATHLALAKRLKACGCKVSTNLPAVADPPPLPPLLPPAPTRSSGSSIAILRKLSSFWPLPRFGADEFELTRSAKIREKLSVSLLLPAGTTRIELHHWLPGALKPLRIPVDGARTSGKTTIVDFELSGPAGIHTFDIWAGDGGTMRLVGRSECVAEEN